MSQAFTRRVTDLAGRPATVLDNGLVRAVVEDFAGITPELSIAADAGRLNTHFNPHFRGSSCAFDAAKHTKTWGGRLGHDLAGNWPCFPAFGNPSVNRGYEIPGCGHTAQLDWTVVSHGVVDAAVTLVTELGGERGENTAGLTYRKYDILLPGHPVHYQVIRIRNHRTETFMFGGAWHNTTGRPFVEKGCRVNACADRWATPPVSHDPAQRERLALDREFDRLDHAPARDGSVADLTVVPGAIGYTDFLTGRVPLDATLGWMSVVNPRERAVYLTFFKGPAAEVPGEFTLRFNHLWLQYGGREFPPFAAYEGGPDRELAVGVESAVSAWGYGLDYADKHPTLMDAPTLLPLAPGEERTLFHGTLVARIPDDALDTGVAGVTAETDGLRVTGTAGATTRFDADADFSRIQKLITQLDAAR